jgi:hypothetical protein
MDAVKCRILLQILDEDIDNLNHYMRILYSQSESLYNFAETVHIIYQLANDIVVSEQNRISNRKVRPEDMKNFFTEISQDIELGMLDNHNVILEGNQIKIVNLMYDITLMLEESSTAVILVILTLI